MSYGENLALFFVLVFGIVIVPGVDMAFTMASGLSGGKKAGLAAVTGIIVGGWFHNLWSALGVGLLLKTFPLAFNILLLVGAAYIAWIGWSLVRSHITLGRIDAATPVSTFTTFRQGLVTSVLNPKAYLFMLAVYPQFIKPQYGAITAQALVMAAIISVTQLVLYGSLGIAAGHSRQFLTARPRMIMAISRMAGGVLIIVAVLTAWPLTNWQVWKSL